jgi:preprotein translocase subunit SecE
VKAWNSLVKFLKEVRSELKKVSWPNKNDVFVNTTAVIVVSVLCGFFIGGVDVLFRNVLKVIF